MKGRIPSLDGLRALSIGIVLLAHCVHLPETRELAFPLAREGATGVNVFFVISGYLITRLLLEEREAFGSIDLRAFYMRRIRRIFPAFYAYLAATVALVILGVQFIRRDELLMSGLYLRNFMANDESHVMTGHLWSLAVEEHFYFLWPALLILVPAKQVSRVVLGLIGAALLTRLFILLLHSAPADPISYWTPCRIDMILFGCLLAIESRSRPLRFGRGPVILAAVVFLASRAYHNQQLTEALQPILGDRFVNLRSLYMRVLSPTIDGTCIAYLVAWCMAFPETMAGRFLNLGPVEWVGRISYSLYLWHPWFFAPPGEGVFRVHPAGALLLSLAFAALSYHWIEKPFLRIPVRSRLRRNPVGRP